MMALSLARLAPLAGIFSLGMLGACMQKELGTPFALADHAAHLAKGTASIVGEGFIRRPNARLARCSGEHVYLIPDTAYFREWIDIRKSGARVANSAELYQTHQSALRSVQCDQNGRFEFADLPPAKWFVLTRMSYRSESEAFAANALFVAQTETKAGESTSVILSNPNRI
jgi:hypothetical protein